MQARDFGANIVNAVRVLESFGAAVEAMRAEIDTALAQLDTTSFRFEEAEDASERSYRDVDEWTQNGWRDNYRVRERPSGKGKGTVIGDLSIGWDAGGLGRPAASLGFPCLIVAWASAGQQWHRDIDCADEPFWPRKREENALLAGGRAVLWAGGLDDEALSALKDNRARDLAWFYLLPLVRIGNRNHVQSMIIGPVLEMLRNTASVEQAMASALSKVPDVLRLSWQDGESQIVP